MGLFSGIKNYINKANDVKGAQIDAAAEHLVDGHEVEVAAQSLQKMKTNLEVEISNIANVEADVQDLKTKIKEKKDASDNLMAKAKALKERSKALETSDPESSKKALDVAMRNCADSEALDKQVDALTKALALQNSLLAEHVSNRDELRSVIEEGESHLDIMKTESSLAKTNDNLASVDTAGAKSSMAQFREMQDKIEHRLTQSRSVISQKKSMSGSSLAEETAAILGEKPGSSKFASL